MSVFADSFVPVSAASSEPLAGRLTSTGQAPWTDSTGQATVVRNGSTGYLQMPAGTFASVQVGNGDVDVSVRTNRLAVRAQSPTGKRYELRVAQQQISGGYYSTESQYQQTYSAYCRYGAGFTAFSYLYQCGNTNFPGSGPRANCPDGSTASTTKYGPVQAVGTCQVYRSYSYTSFTAQLWVVDGQGRETVAGDVVTTSGTSALLRLRAEGPTVTAWVDGTQAAQVTDDDPVSRSRNRLMFGSPSLASTATDFVVDTLNTAPNAPQTAQPTTNKVTDRTVTTRLAWLFNDPDAGDMQSQYDLRYRIVGADTWQTVTMATPDNFADFAPGTFDDGARYEWQVRTYDRAGLVGPYSAVDYFRVGTPPAVPVWVVPTDGGQIPTQFFAASWSAPAQVAYQVRVDSDTASVSDTGRVASTERGLQLQFPKNRVDRYLSVRVEAGELWSAWAVVKVTVSYTPPAITLLELTPRDDEGCIHVQLRVPTPRGTQPRVISQQLFRVEGDAPEQLVAVNLIGDALWIDWTPASGVNNRYRVIAYADNGTTSDSGLVEESTVGAVVVAPSAYSEFYATRY